MKTKLAVLIISWLYEMLRKKHSALPSIEWEHFPLQFNIDWFQTDGAKRE